RRGIELGALVFPFAQTFRDRQWQARIDHKLGENDQLSGRYLYDDNISPTGGATPGFPVFFPSAATRFQNLAVSETHVFSSKLTNELRLSYNRIALSFPLDPANPTG